MENPALVVAALPAEVKLLGLVGVAEFAAGGELRPEFDQLLNRRRARLDNRPDRADVAKSGPRGEGVLDMLVERIQPVHDAGDAALGETTVALVDLPLGQNRHAPPGPRQMKGAGEPRQTAADHDVVKLHCFVDFHLFRSFRNCEATFKSGLRACRNPEKIYAKPAFEIASVVNV